MGEIPKEIPRCEYVYNAKDKVSKGSMVFGYRYRDIQFEQILEQGPMIMASLLQHDEAML
jgi:hypothetical protein